jgi:hypothetical protein
MRMYREINTKVSNFLRAFRFFLDQSKENLEDRYAKNSSQGKELTKATIEHTMTTFPIVFWTRYAITHTMWATRCTIFPSAHMPPPTAPERPSTA